ncbi:unnamed protein product [Symbiodinium natans]|uniref:Uncharacterized protein n=1 Tax=Symbiodinium natans TaxID=878477 RepID=A0A812KN96_9DINO|nr:unnamed protein product [Symbiodinium natans]
MDDVTKTTTYLSRSSSNIVSERSERSLRVEIAPELLRGVSLHECLSGWAKHWASSREDRNGYKLSRQTTHLDNFLSHDWATSRWLKLAALLVIFNSRAAAVSTLVASVLAGLMRAWGILPDEAWTVVIGYGTFFVFFCFWQRIRAAWKPRTVFLDKLCIAQHDAALKEQGIMGLAAFLDRSEKLTVLWSPRYFQRLWCMFEISTFLRKTARTQIEMMPVKLALLLCVNTAKWFIMAIGYHIITDASDHEKSSWTRTLVVAGPCVLLAGSMLPWTYYVGIGMMEDLSLMPAQLASFRIQDTRSACCSQEHLHPESGGTIPCDRELVFATLHSWLGRSGDSGDRYLDDFNGLVRERLAPSVLKTVGGDNLPVGYTLYMAASCHVPFISSYIAELAKGPPNNYSGGDAVVWAVRIFVDWAFVAMLAVTTTRLNFFLCEYGYRMGCRSRLCLAFALSQSVVLLVTGFWVGKMILSNRVERSSLLPVLPFLILLGLTIAVFRKGSKNATKGKRSDGDGREAQPVEDARPGIEAEDTESTFGI